MVHFLKSLMLLSACLLSSSCREGTVNMNAAGFRELISGENVILLDVRTPEEFAESHIDGAVNIDFKSVEFETLAADFLKQTGSTVAVYCRSGRRSAEACIKLAALGYEKTVNLSGGIIGWKEAGYETVAGPDPDTEYACGLLPAGTEAPDFTLTAPDGQQVTLSSFRGHYVVLDFWASWCPDCRKDLPDIQAAYTEHQPEGVVFIGVSFDDDRTRWTDAISGFGLTYLQVSELKKWKETEISPLYHIKWIPTMYVIDPEGKVVLGTVMVEKMTSLLKSL